jgi:Domain of unknown function (DUF6249)
MYCPKCGSNQSDELRFCKSCGANLQVVRQTFATLETGETGEKFNWSKTWFAEMLLSEEESKRRRAEVERRLGITPEMKRANEVKAGVITSCAGVGLMIFLFVFMEGLIRSGVVPAHVAEILSRVWIVGVIPFFVGIGLMINGLVVSKKLGEVAGKNLSTKPDALETDAERPALRSADTKEFITPGFSVTEETTKHLKSSGQKR